MLIYSILDFIIAEAVNAACLFTRYLSRFAINGDIINIYIAVFAARTAQRADVLSRFAINGDIINIYIAVFSACTA